MRAGADSELTFLGALTLGARITGLRTAILAQYCRLYGRE